MEILLKSFKKIKNIFLEPNPNPKSLIPNPQSPIPNPQILKSVKFLLMVLKFKICVGNDDEDIKKSLKINNSIDYVI